jgi:hypothetical protein
MRAAASRLAISWYVTVRMYMPGIVVSECKCFIDRVGDRDFPEIAPRGRCRLGRRKIAQLAPDFRLHLLAESSGSRHEDGRAVRTVLGLAEQVGRNEKRISRLVSDDKNFSRSRE